MRKTAWFKALLAIAAVTLVLPATAAAAPKKEKTGSLTQVGHEPLMNRGMNAAITIHEDFAYIGSRTDGGHEDMPHGGVMIVDISDPSSPTLLGPPFDARAGESSRELTVWTSQEILIVLNTNCGVRTPCITARSRRLAVLPVLRLGRLAGCGTGSRRSQCAANCTATRGSPRHPQPCRSHRVACTRSPSRTTEAAPTLRS